MRRIGRRGAGACDSLEQHLNGGAPRWGLTHNTDALESKVSRPPIGAGMKQSDQFAGGGIAARNVWSLVTIAMRAREREIRRNGFSLVLFGDYVIDLEPQWKGKLR